MSSKNLGLLSIIFVYTVWGMQAMYWKLFQNYNLLSILAYRIIWSFILLFLIVAAAGKFKNLLLLFSSWKSAARIALCAFLISLNWLLNIYAAYSNQLVEASLGQYITPIAVICSGIFILKEKIRFYESAALLIAGTGVVFLTWSTGNIPVIAVFLILTFAVYTFLKKIFDIDPFLGITAEVMILAPFAFVCLLLTEFTGITPDADLNYLSGFLLQASTGLFTAVPLVLFSYGVKQINLSRLGFIQYYAPSLSLIIGVFIYGETFSGIHFISFMHIWTAILIVMVFSLYRNFQSRQ